MHQTIAGNERPVLHRRMAAQRRAVGKDDVAADHAVVRDVRARHEHARAADPGRRAPPTR